ncbi:MAG: thioesterase domain-containing protein [Pirellulaceae bacterium]
MFDCNEQPCGPYRLAGWSFGGLVAYEMARQLKANGHEVSELVIIDSALIYSFAMLRYLFANRNNYFAADVEKGL